MFVKIVLGLVGLIVIAVGGFILAIKLSSDFERNRAIHRGPLARFEESGDQTPSSPDGTWKDKIVRSNAIISRYADAHNNRQQIRDYLIEKGFYCRDGSNWVASQKKHQIAAHLRCIYGFGILEGIWTVVFVFDQNDKIVDRMLRYRRFDS